MKDYLQRNTNVILLLNFHCYISSVTGGKKSGSQGQSAILKNEKHDNYTNNIGRQQRIVGGFTVLNISQYPYHASYADTCGAAIIGKRWALTAAHCGKLSPYVKFGSRFAGQGTKGLITNFHVHPNWFDKNKANNYDYDYQLLELKASIKFGIQVQPIKIAFIEDMVVGKVITVTGFGRVIEKGPLSPTLQAVRLPIIAKSLCQEVKYRHFRNTLTPRMFCAGYFEGVKDGCQGDSGGPAVANNRLLGLVSFGYGCARPGAFGVYAKVSEVRSWIANTTNLILI